MSTPAPGRLVDAALQLLDRQLIDCDGSAAGKVDDLELAELADGSLVVVAVLTGPGALAPRLGGRLGSAWAAVVARLHPDAEPEPARIPFGVVKDLSGSHVELSVPRHHLDGNRLEHWTRTNLIERIPGAHHEPE